MQDLRKITRLICLKLAQGKQTLARLNFLYDKVWKLKKSDAKIFAHVSDENSAYLNQIKLKNLISQNVS